MPNVVNINGAEINTHFKTYST